MIGKTISFSVLYKNNAEQRPPYITLIAKSGGAIRTISCSALQFSNTVAAANSGWMWATANGIPIDPDINPDGYAFYLRMLPGFGTTPPSSNEPLYIQRIISVEGGLPKGNLSSEEP